jgi:Fe-S oxidoreductase
VAQAKETGASTLVSSCPYCIQNFEDGIKTKGLTGMRVADVAEVLADRVGRNGI